MFRNRPPTRGKIFGLLVLLPWLVSCRSSPAEDAADNGSSGPDAWFPIRFGSATLQLQVVVSQEERNQGLMHRKSLAKGHGMLFLSERPERQSFWMKNTWIPLDIGFFGPDGTLLEIRKMHPHVERSVKSSSDNALFAVELNRNAYRAAGIEIGVKMNLGDLRKALTSRGIDPAEHGL